MSRLKEEEDNRRLKKKRIANSEYEAVTLIVQSNPILKKRVLNRIRELRAWSQESLADVANKAKTRNSDKSGSENE